MVSGGAHSSQILRFAQDKLLKVGGSCARFMRIVHFSDTHLGYHKYQKLDSRTGLNQREQDVYDAFEFVISTILRSQPDLVLHAGDLFDSFHPSNRTLSFCLEQLKRLTAEVPQSSTKFSEVKDSGYPSAIRRHNPLPPLVRGRIPIVIISGNHSWPKQQIKGSVFSVLSQFPGIHAVHNETYQLLRFNGISVHATPHCASQEKLEAELSKVTPDPNADYNVAILHASIPYIATNFYVEPSQISVNPDKLLELEMDYIALGHSHCAKVVQENACYCGSTERFSFIESDEQKKFLEVDLANPSPKKQIITHTIPTRPMECIEIDAYGLSAKKIIEQIREDVKFRDIENAIVLVQLIGINRAAFNTLDFRSLSALFEKAFHVEYLPQFYSGVEIPDSIRLVKSMQEDFKIFISEQEMDEQEREELLKLGLEYLR
jgi:DNA repair exonuclease SbcCD nuclease subunit